MLSTAVSDNERDWDLQRSMLLLAYRTSRHETTGTTPFFLMFGRDPRLPENVMYSSIQYCIVYTNYNTAQEPGPSEDILPAPVAQVPGQPAPAAVWQSTRQTRPPVRYGDPISLPDDVEIL